MNKTLLTIVQVFAMVPAVSLLIIAVILRFVDPISGLFIMLYSNIHFLIAATMMRAKQGEATRNQVLGWGIVLICISGVIGGIFAIIASASEDAQSVFYEGYQTELEKSLQQLKKAHQQQLISKNEYEQNRNMLIYSSLKK